MGNGTIPADDDDEVTDPSIRTPELDEELPSSARPPPLPSARVARELPPQRPPLSGRPPPLPLARPTTPSRPPPPPGALLRAPPPSAPRPSPAPPDAPRPSSMPPPRAPAAAVPTVARPPALPPARLPSIPPPRQPSPPPSPQLTAGAPARLPSPAPSPQLPSAPTPPRASSAAVPSTPPLRAAASAPPRLNESLSYTARRPSDPPPIAATLDVGRLAQLQRELDETQGRASKLLAELSSLRPAMLELEAARKRITELEARVVELSTSKPRDDLRRIKGIGPKFEQALRDAGVCTFEQIASWSDADIAAIAATIGARVDRIEREEWVGKARALLAAP